MPVADEGQDQDERCDHQQAGRFQGVDLGRAVMYGGSVFGQAWIRLPFWTRRRHGNIVAPETGGVPQKIWRGLPTFRERWRPTIRITV
jgi:hypothetical protein